MIVTGLVTVSYEEKKNRQEPQKLSTFQLLGFAVSLSIPEFVLIRHFKSQILPSIYLGNSLVYPPVG
jgi:hypothetical protein